MYINKIIKNKSITNKLIGISIILIGIVFSIFIYQVSNQNNIILAQSDECISGQTCQSCNPNCPDKCATGCLTPFGCSAPAYPRCDSYAQAGTHYTCFLGQCQSIFGPGENDCNSCLGINVGSLVKDQTKEEENINIIITTTTIKIFQENCCTNRRLIPLGAIIKKGHTCNIDAACWTCPPGQSVVYGPGIARCVPQNAACIPEEIANEYLGVNTDPVWSQAPPYSTDSTGCPEGTTRIVCNKGYYLGSAAFSANPIFGLVYDESTNQISWGLVNATFTTGLRCLPDVDNTITGCTNNPSICPAIFGPEYTYTCENNLCTIIITTTTQQTITYKFKNSLPKDQDQFEIQTGVLDFLLEILSGNQLGLLTGNQSRTSEFSLDESTIQSESQSGIRPESSEIQPEATGVRNNTLNHLECNPSKQCISVPGPGPDRCKEDKDCGWRRSAFVGKCEFQNGTRFCVNKACNPNIPGDCTGECKTDLDCNTEGTNTHLECYNNACVIVGSPGQNKCNKIGQGCQGDIREIIPFLNPPSLNQFIKQTAGIFWILGM